MGVRTLNCLLFEYVYIHGYNLIHNHAKQMLINKDKMKSIFNYNVFFLVHFNEQV